MIKNQPAASLRGRLLVVCCGFAAAAGCEQPPPPEPVATGSVLETDGPVPVLRLPPYEAATTTLTEADPLALERGETIFLRGAFTPEYVADGRMPGALAAEVFPADVPAGKKALAMMAAGGTAKDAPPGEPWTFSLGVKMPQRPGEYELRLTDSDPRVEGPDAERLLLVKRVRVE